MIESLLDLHHAWPSILVKLLVAAICGLLLGIERESRDKPAGLRTIVLITVGSALYMIVGELIPNMPFFETWPSDITRTDPSRIASQVVTGIGFLGAGTIIHARGAVHGLTTAAVIWVAAGIGLCVGVGFPVLSLGITLLVLATLTATRPIRRWLSRRGEARSLTLVVPDDSLALARVEQALSEHEVEEDEVAIRAYGDKQLQVQARYHAGSRGAASRLLEALARIDGVQGVPRGERAGE